MNLLLLLLLFLALALHLTQSLTSLPETEEIAQVSFVREGRIFFLTKSRGYFGFIQTASQTYEMIEQLKPQEEVMGFDGQLGYFILRKERTKALIFRLATLNIHSINVQIKFQHQKLMAVTLKEDKYEVITNKDFRVYQADEVELTEDARHTLTSCSKQEWFLKGLSEEDTVRIVLIKGQQICLRVLKEGEKTVQKCLFKLTSEISQISRIIQGILIQTEQINYVVRDNFQVYSFKGEVVQVNDQFGTLREEFKSFDFARAVLVEGMSVQGSTKEHSLWLRGNEKQGIDVIHNLAVVWTVARTDRPIRAWLHLKSEESAVLVLQFAGNQLVFQQLSLGVAPVAPLPVLDATIDQSKGIPSGESEL